MSKFIDSLSDKTSYNEFKYVIQDSGSYGIGAKYSYEECMQCENVPFKFKAIIEHYISKDTMRETTIESHLYYLTEDMFSARTYKELKAKVKIGISEEKRSFFSKKTKRIYSERIMSVDDFTQMSVSEKKQKSVAVYELIISKLALMSFSV